MLEGDGGAVRSLAERVAWHTPLGASPTVYLAAPPQGHPRHHTNPLTLLRSRCSVCSPCVAPTHARPTYPSDSHTHDFADHDSEEMIKLKEQATYKLGEVYGAIE